MLYFLGPSFDGPWLGERPRGVLCRGRSSCAVIALTILPASLPAQPTFVEVGNERGLATYAQAPFMGGGVAVADIDDDGDLDLFLPTDEGTPDRLYRNLGDGSFEEIAAEVGLADMARSRVGLWIDVDGDSRLDLVLAGDCYGNQISCVPGQPLLRLYRQDAEGQFTDITTTSGLTDDAGTHLISQHRGGLAAGDLDGDGDLDLYAAWWGDRSRLYRNLGDGTFEAVGISAGPGLAERTHWQPILFDADGDGRLDIFVTIDFETNELWLNRGDAGGELAFEEVAVAVGLGTAYNEMGVTVGDADNDGDFDLYATNIYEYEPGSHNVFFRREPGLAWVEVAESLGVADTGWGWGTTFGDLDGDGDLELGATNGFSFEPYTSDRSRLFRNLLNENRAAGEGGTLAFEDISTAAGFDDSYWGNTLLAVDLDRDGDLDLLQTAKEHGGSTTGTGHLRLLDNRSPAARFLLVEPRMPAPNHRAIGAVVELQIGDERQLRLVTAGTSFLGQEPAEANFGLATSPRVDRLSILWPDGRRTALGGLEADQRIVVRWEGIFHDGFEGGNTLAWSRSRP